LLLGACGAIIEARERIGALKAMASGSQRIVARSVELRPQAARLLHDSIRRAPGMGVETKNAGFSCWACLTVLSAVYPWNMDTWRVLLVDPIADDRELQAHVLQSAGLDVIEPSDNPFKEAIERRPDAVVVDVSPQRPGSREFVETLKQDPRTESIPVVVVSGFPRTDMPKTEGFVAKPCAPNQIVAEVIRVVKDRPVR
jgi:CheY-like chemotaxis protein